MGEAKIKAKTKQMNDKKFLAQDENKNCCYCGDEATTVDHFPPRCIFENRAWPEGHRYPSCEPCNSSKKKDEQALNCLSRLMDLDAHKDLDRMKKIIRETRNNTNLFQLVSMDKGNEAKRHILQKFGSESTVSQMGLSDGVVIKFGPQALQALQFFCINFAKTLSFTYLNKIFYGTVFWNYMDSEGMNDPDLNSVLKSLNITPELTRNNKDISNQFYYSLYANDDLIVSIFRFREKSQHVFLLFAVDENTSKMELYRQVVGEKFFSVEVPRS